MNKSTVHLPHIKRCRNSRINGIVEQEKLRCSIDCFCWIHPWRYACSSALSECFYYRVIHLLKTIHSLTNSILYGINETIYKSLYEVVLIWRNYQYSHGQFLPFQNRYRTTVNRFNDIVCERWPVTINVTFHDIR